MEEEEPGHCSQPGEFEGVMSDIWLHSPFTEWARERDLYAIV